MHERGAVGTALARFLGETEGTRVVRATGRYRADVDPKVVEDVWAHFVEGTPAAGAALELLPAASPMKCFTCETPYEGDKLDPCPRCGGSGLPVSEPPEFEIVDWAVA